MRPKYLLILLVWVVQGSDPSLGFATSLQLGLIKSKSTNLNPPRHILVKILEKTGFLTASMSNKLSNTFQNQRDYKAFQVDSGVIDLNARFIAYRFHYINKKSAKSLYFYWFF